VTSFRVERTDGDFKGGHKAMWHVFVTTLGLDEPVRLRPSFFEAVELCWFVDQVFPGSAFTLMPPDVVSDGPDTLPESQLDARPRFIDSKQLADIIRSIGEGMGGGDAYVPPQGYRPPPGTHVAI